MKLRYIFGLNLFLCAIYPLTVIGQEWIQWDVVEYGDIAFHPDSSQILYIGTTSNFGHQRRGALMVSYDYGNTLDTLFQDLSIGEIEFHPSSPDTLLLTCGSQNSTRAGVLKVVRNGTEHDTTWIDEGIRLWDDRSVFNIEIDSVSPDTMFAGTIAFGAGHIWRTINGGLTWSDAHPGYIGDVIFVRQHPVNTNAIYYTAGWLPRIYRSYDWGETWSETTGCCGEDESISSIILFPDNPGRILISSIGTGAYLSNDYGDSWESWNDHLPSVMAREIILDSSNSNHLYLATNDSIFFSNDFGESWSDYTFNIGEISYGLDRLTYDSVNNRLFAGAYWSGLFSLDLNTVSVEAYNPSYGNIKLQLMVFPNPTNPSGSLSYYSLGRDLLTIEFYDILGRKLSDRTIEVQVGQNVFPLVDIYYNIFELPSGIYFIKAGNQESTLVSKYMLVR